MWDVQCILCDVREIILLDQRKISGFATTKKVKSCEKKGFVFYEKLRFLKSFQEHKDRKPLGFLVFYLLEAESMVKAPMND